MAKRKAEEKEEEGVEAVEGKGQKKAKKGEDDAEGGKKKKAAPDKAVLPQSKLTYTAPATTGASISIVSTNVAGIRAVLRDDAKSKSFAALISTQQPDILCLQETKIQESHHAEVGEALLKLAPGYKAYFSSSTEKLGYSGTCVLVKGAGGGVKTIADMFGKKKDKEGEKDSKVNVVSVAYGLGDAAPSDKIANNEGRVITIELNSFYLVNTYVPNSGQNLDRLEYRVGTWDKQFAKYLKSLEAKKPVVWVGDLNVAHRNEDIHNLYLNDKFPSFGMAEEDYSSNKDLKKVKDQAGCTMKERNSFTAVLADYDFVDSFRHFHPDSQGHFTYWSQRAGNRVWNRGLRLDYAIVSKSLLDGSGGASPAVALLDGSGGASPAVVDSFICGDYTGPYTFADHCPIGCVVQL